MLYFLLGNLGRGSRDSGVQGGLISFIKKFTFSGADIFLGFFFSSESLSVDALLPLANCA